MLFIQTLQVVQNVKFLRDLRPLITFMTTIFVLSNIGLTLCMSDGKGVQTVFTRFFMWIYFICNAILLLSQAIVSLWFDHDVRKMLR